MQTHLTPLLARTRSQTPRLARIHMRRERKCRRLLRLRTRLGDQDTRRLGREHHKEEEGVKQPETTTSIESKSGSWHYRVDERCGPIRTQIGASDAASVRVAARAYDCSGYLE